MRLNNQILSNLKEDKEDWYYLCNDAEQALFKVKNQCNDERAIKTIERMIIDLNSIRMEQYETLNEYSLVEEDRPLLKKAKEQLDFLNTKLADVNDEVVNKTRKELEDKIANYEKHNKEKSLKEDEQNPNAKIYQIRDVANTDYAFRGYDEVVDKIDLNDYDLVATIYVPDEDDDALEKIFTYGNTDKSKFTMIKPMRSISVSDIIEYDGAKYYVDSFGFKEL